jgi:hypothetical protein
MATRVADLAVPPDQVMVDTNVLLAATDEGRAEHHDALTILNDWPAGDTTRADDPAGGGCEGHGAAARPAGGC